MKKTFPALLPALCPLLSACGGAGKTALPAVCPPVVEIVVK